MTKEFKQAYSDILSCSVICANRNHGGHRSFMTKSRFEIGSRNSLLRLWLLYKKLFQRVTRYLQCSVVNEDYYNNEWIISGRHCHGDIMSTETSRDITTCLRDLHQNAFMCDVKVWVRTKVTVPWQIQTSGLWTSPAYCSENVNRHLLSFSLRRGSSPSALNERLGANLKKVSAGQKPPEQAHSTVTITAATSVIFSDDNDVQMELYKRTNIYIYIYILGDDN